MFTHWMIRAAPLALLVTCLQVSIGDDALRERLLRDGPQGWRQLESREQQFVGSARFDEVYRREGQVFSHVSSEMKIKRNGQWILFEFPISNRLKPETEVRNSVLG